MLPPLMKHRRPHPGQHRVTRRCGLLCAAGLALLPDIALANPHLEGIRQLSLAGSGRASATGVDAALVNPSGLTATQQFAIAPVYQYSVANNAHGLGALIIDSLNNPKFGLGLGYTFFRGEQPIGYSDLEGGLSELETLRLGHEAYGLLSVNLFRGVWHLAVKPKWQYSVLQYRDEDGEVRNFRDKLNTFGLDVATSISILRWLRLSVTGENLVGAADPSWTTEDTDLPGVETFPVPLDLSQIRRLSDFPRTLTHGLSVFPLGDMRLSINFDGLYDFTSYWDADADLDGVKDEHVRLMYGGSVEFIAGPVPIRVGGSWDGRGPGTEDDAAFVGAGAGFVQPAGDGGVGWELNAGFSQQVTGERLDTVIGLSLGIRLRPSL